MTAATQESLIIITFDLTLVVRASSEQLSQRCIDRYNMASIIITKVDLILVGLASSV